MQDLRNRLTAESDLLDRLRRAHDAPAFYVEAQFDRGRWSVVTSDGPAGITVPLIGRGASFADAWTAAEPAWHVAPAAEPKAEGSGSADDALSAVRALLVAVAWYVEREKPGLRAFLQDKLDWQRGAGAGVSAPADVDLTARFVDILAKPAPDTSRAALERDTIDKAFVTLAGLVGQVTDLCDVLERCAGHRAATAN